MNSKFFEYDFWNRLEAVAAGNEDFSWTSDDGVWIHKEYDTWCVTSKIPYFPNTYIQEGDSGSSQDQWLSDIIDRLEAAYA